MGISSQPIPVLYEDQNLIAVDKPSGILVHAFKKETNERDHLLRRLKQQTGHYLYPVHRLDRPVLATLEQPLTYLNSPTYENQGSPRSAE